MRTRLAIALLLAAGTAGCSYLQFLPLFKRQIVTKAQGRSVDQHGPAFGDPVARTAIDAAVDWPAYNDAPTSTRYSTLSQITTANVSRLRRVCTFDTGERTSMQSGPVVVAGVMYVTTAIDTYALDAATCRLRWRHTYDYYPHPDWDLKVNRGVAYVETAEGPRLVRGANDGRVYALDARTGHEVWNIPAGDVKHSETFPAAPIAWHGVVFIGNAGGDNFGVTGRMLAIDARTGERVWTTELVPTNGRANETWPRATERMPHTGGATWTSYTLDTVSALLYVPTGNAAPDFLTTVREGDDLYTSSVVVLDARTGTIRRAYQLLRNDPHDWDVAAAPLLVRTGRGRELVAEAGKDGHLYGIDRDAGTILYRTPITTIENADAPLTKDGTRFCPGVQGGVEWNGPAYSPLVDAFFVGAVDWCSIVRVGTARELADRVGVPWTGSAHTREPFGTFDPPSRKRGWLTAVDAEDGHIRWQRAAQTPLVAGVLATAGGVVFSADLNGVVTAYDQRDGTPLFEYRTGQPIGGGIVSYAVAGRQYVAVASGLHAPLTWKTNSSPATIVVLSLP
jgi:alcohol dehydrogenase (cytochrome c)